MEAETSTAPATIHKRRRSSRPVWMAPVCLVMALFFWLDQPSMTAAASVSDLVDESQHQERQQYHHSTDIYDETTGEELAQDNAMSLFSRHNQIDLCSRNFARDYEGPSCNDNSINNWGCTCKNSRFRCHDDSTQTRCFAGAIEGSCHMRFDNVPVCLVRLGGTKCVECQNVQDCWNQLNTVDSRITCAYQDRPIKTFCHDFPSRDCGPMICMQYHNGQAMPTPVPPPIPMFPSPAPHPSAMPSWVPSPDPSGSSEMPTAAPSSGPSPSGLSEMPTGAPSGSSQPSASAPPSTLALCSQGDEFCCGAADDGCRFFGQTYRSNCFALAQNDTTIQMETKFDLGEDFAFPYRMALPYWAAESLNVRIYAKDKSEDPPIPKIDVTFTTLNAGLTNDDMAAFAEASQSQTFDGNISMVDNVLRFTIFDGEPLYELPVVTGSYLEPMQVWFGFTLGGGVEEQEICLWVEDS